MSDAISVDCPHCEAKLKLKNKGAVGKKVACPKCQRPFVVPAPPDNEDDLAFMNVKESDEFGEPIGDEEELTPLPPSTRRSGSKRGKKGKQPSSGNWKKPALIGGMCLGIVGLLGGVGVLVYMLLGDLLGGGGGKFDLAYLPGNAEVVVQARIADASNSSLFQTVISSPQFKPRIDRIKQQTGLELQDISEITVGIVGFTDSEKQKAGSDSTTPFRLPGSLPLNMLALGGTSGGSPQMAVTVIRTKSVLDLEKIRAAGKATASATHQAATYYKMAEGGADSMVIWSPDSTTLVLSDETGIKQAIEAGASPPHRPEFDFVDGSWQIIAAVVPKDPTIFAPTGPAGLGMVSTVPFGGILLFGGYQPNANGGVAGMSLGMTASDGVEWGVALNCTSNETANELSRAMTAGMKELNSLILKTQVKAEVSAAKDAILMKDQKFTTSPQLAEMEKLSKALFDSIESKASGSVFRVTGEFPSAINSQGGLSFLRMIGIPGIPSPMDSNPFPGQSALTGQGFGGSLADGQTNGSPTSPQGTSPGGGNPVLEAQGAAQTSQSRNNLKQVVLGMLNYHDRHHVFPDAAIRDASGTPLLSWRVAILPFVGQEALYQQFHLNEPWDSEHNKKLIDQIPATFRSPASKAPPGTTTYLLPTGPGAIFENGKGCRFQDILDGTSNTLLVVEASDELAVPWTKPDDLAFDPQNPFKGLISPNPGGFLGATADGAVFLFKPSLSAETLLLLFQRNDGKPVPAEGWRS
ncbi:MAG: DUF1559 domain-containing protein [Planctomycetales bacterium]